MRKPPWLLTLMVVLVEGLRVRAADAPLPEIVVAMRYYQQTGTSHAHLYLYREDGKLLRQLTDDNTVQDRDPVFSPDGETIVFTRANDKGGKDCWSIEPRGGNLHKLPATPDWYTGTKNAPVISVDLLGTTSSDSPDSWEEKQRAALSGLTSGEPLAVEKRPSLAGPVDLLALGQQLQAPPLRVAFFALHLDSTNGDTVCALDLNARRLVRLSPNWATPFPLPGEPAFLTRTENRYVPYGDGKHTENSSYIEHWDAGLNVVRYAKGKAAGDCAGASMYRPGLTPAVVAIRTDDK